MTLKNISRWLIPLAVAVAIPGISCVGYYAINDLGPLSTLMTILVILAYPATLIGFSWFISVCLAERRGQRRLWISGLCFAIPSLFLLLTHF